MISVIVAVYNIESYVKKCLESIIDQTYKDLQIIVINDGSTDKSGAIADFCAGLDSRIEVYHTENRGLVSARKEGLKHAKGDYISFVDGDDYMEPFMLDKMYKWLDRTQADFVHAGYFESVGDLDKERILFNQGIIKFDSDEQRVDAICKYVFDDINEPIITSSIWSKLFKRDIAMYYNEIDESSSFGEDLLFLVLCLLRCKTVALLDESLYHYRYVEGGLSRACGSDKLFKEINLEQNLKRIIENSGYDMKLKKSLSHYCYSRMTPLLISLFFKGYYQRYLFPRMELLKNKRIVLYGAGRVGRDYMLHLLENNIDICAWIDSKSSGQCIWGHNIESPGIVAHMNFDAIVIALFDGIIADEVICVLKGMGVEMGKIVWEKPLDCFAYEKLSLGIDN